MGNKVVVPVSCNISIDTKLIEILRYKNSTTPELSQEEVLTKFLSDIQFFVQRKMVQVALPGEIKLDYTMAATKEAGAL